MITLAHTKQGEANIVSIEGRLELSGMGRFQEAFKELVSPGATVVIDLSAVTHIDSSGVSALVGLHQRTREFYLLEPADPVERLLRLANLNKYFKILNRAELDRRFPPAS